MRLTLALVAFMLSAWVGLRGQAQRPRVFRTERGGPQLEITARARTGVQPKSVSVSPDGNRVVVCNFGRPDRESVFVYTTDTLTRVGVIEFPGNAVESVFSADGATLYVSNFREHVVEVIDFAACRSATAESPCHPTPRATIATGQHPKFMALSPDGATLYVANWGDRSVSVVDLATLSEVRRLPTLRHPRGMVVRADGTLLAAAFHGDVLHAFPSGAEVETQRFAMCALPRHLLLAPDDRRLLVTCSMGFLGFYDAHTGERTGIAPLGRNPRSIAMTRDARFVSAANFSSSDVSIVDTEARTHRTVPVPGAQRIVGIAMHPESRRLRVYATSWDTNELILLEGTP